MKHDIKSMFALCRCKFRHMLASGCSVVHTNKLTSNRHGEENCVHLPLPAYIPHISHSRPRRQRRLNASFPRALAPTCLFKLTQQARSPLLYLCVCARARACVFWVCLCVSVCVCVYMNIASGALALPVPQNPQLCCFLCW